jgi:hypothetical protein
MFCNVGFRHRITKFQSDIMKFKQIQFKMEYTRWPRCLHPGHRLHVQILDTLG